MRGYLATLVVCAILHFGISNGRRVKVKLTLDPNAAFSNGNSNTELGITISGGSSSSSKSSGNGDGSANGIILRPGPNKIKEIQSFVLIKINIFRKKHKAPPLEIDVLLTEGAQAYAEEMAMTGKVTPSCKSATCAYGENVAVVSKFRDLNIAINITIQRWYNGKKDYDFQTGDGGSPATEGFTAIIWKGSKKLGIGVAGNKASGNIYIVFRFWPPGNIEGEFLENVFPPSKPVTAITNAPPAKTTTIKTKPPKTKPPANTKPPKTKPPKTKPPAKPTPPRSKPKPGCAAAGPCAKSKVGNQVQKDGMEAINKIRVKHHVKPVCLDDNLNKNAQKWAESIAKENKLDLSCIGYSCCYGEIQAQRPTGDGDLSVHVKGAIQKWYEEVKEYDYKKGLSNKGKIITGFTAIAWKGSTKIGVGVAKGKSFVFVVIQFSPPGNTKYEYFANVLKP